MYEDEDDEEDADADPLRVKRKRKRSKMVKRARKRLRKCCKSCRTKLVKPDKKGRDNAYLSKLLDGSDFFMGDNGTVFKKGVTINLCCFCKCRWFIFHFPPGLLEDFYYYVSNNHGLFSAINAEVGHPYRRIERNFSFLALGSLTFLGVVGLSFYGTSQTNTVAFQVSLGVANFLLRNVFQVLFACTCLFTTGAERRNPLMRCVENSGTVVGCLAASVLSVGMLLAASLLCGDGGVALVTFVIRSQIPSIFIGVMLIFIQFIPFVFHLSDLPLLGDMTITGAWYLDKYEASKEYEEEWEQERDEGAGGRNIIQKQHFWFFEINFNQYCCPLIPYFTTNPDFDPDLKKSTVTQTATTSGGVSKVHPAAHESSATSEEKEVKFIDIEAISSEKEQLDGDNVST